MIDPVNNFQIPDEWIGRARVQVEKLAEMISSGRFVLLSDGSLLRRGYTTGTTAAAAAKAAVLSLEKEISEVSVPTPIGLRVLLPVEAKRGRAKAVKDAGDHGSDATRGMEIVAEAREHDSIVIKAGAGIGSRKGIPAINPSPAKQIEDAIKEALQETGLSGACVTLSVPGGEAIAKHTLNEKVGIVGGISILGTTGFVEPWNEHLGEMKEELIRRSDRLVLTTGRIGMRFSHMLFPDYDIVLIGSDISRGLRAGKGKVVLCGLPGLILKWAAPDMLKDTTVQELIEEDSPLIDQAFEKAVELSGKRVVLLNRNGTILRDSGEKE